MTMAHSEFKFKIMCNATVNISQTVTDTANIVLLLNRKSHVGFRLLDLTLTLAYSKRQLDSWKGVSRNILALFSLTSAHGEDGQTASAPVLWPPTTLVYLI